MSINIPFDDILLPNGETARSRRRFGQIPQQDEVSSAPIEGTLTLSPEGQSQAQPEFPSSQSPERG